MVVTVCVPGLSSLASPSVLLVVAGPLVCNEDPSAFLSLLQPPGFTPGVILTKNGSNYDFPEEAGVVHHL